MFLTFLKNDIKKKYKKYALVKQYIDICKWIFNSIVIFFSRCLVDSSIIMCYIGVGAVYVVFISGIVQEFYDFEGIDHKYIVLILFPFFFVMNMMKYLNDIAIISIIGNLFLFVAAVIAVVYALKDGIGGEWVTINQNVGLYPKFVGTVFFSISSPGIVSHSRLLSAFITR